MRLSIGAGISLPRQIITRIDAELGDVPRSRYVLRILERMHEDSHTKLRTKEKKGNQVMLDHSGVETSVIKQSPSS
jgi:hypothetical protein